MSYQFYAPLGSTGLTVYDHIVRDVDGYYRETVSGTFVVWSGGVSGTFQDDCTERSGRRVYDSSAIDMAAWDDGFYSIFHYDNTNVLKANGQFYVKGGVPRLSDELVGTVAETEAEIAAEHGDGSYEGSGAPSVDDIAARIIIDHGSGSYVDTGDTKENIASEVKTVLEAAHGTESWEGDTASVIAAEVLATLQASQGPGSWEGSTPAVISTQVMADMLIAHGSGNYNYTPAEIAAGVDTVLGAAHGVNSWESGNYEAVVGMVFDSAYNDGAGQAVGKAFLLHNGQVVLDDLTSATFTLYDSDPDDPVWTGAVVSADDYGVFRLAASPFNVLEANVLYTMACAIVCDGVTYTSANLHLSVR